MQAGRRDGALHEMQRRACVLPARFALGVTQRADDLVLEAGALLVGPSEVAGTEAPGIVLDRSARAGRASAYAVNPAAITAPPLRNARRSSNPFPATGCCSRDFSRDKDLGLCPIVASRCRYLSSWENLLRCPCPCSG